MNIKSLLLLTTLGLQSLPLAAAASDLPAALQAMEARGVNIMESFEAPAGLTGYIASYNGQPLSLYLTRDQQHVIAGTLFDASGRDLSREPLDRLAYGPLAEAQWEQLQNSHWIADGSAQAERIVYVFSDPNCPYCSLFWNQARPWVESGKLQLRHVMVGMLREDSAGKAAALLSAPQPQQALARHERAGRASTLSAMGSIPAELQQQLDSNLELMGRLGASATPAIFYRDADGRLQQQAGAPGSARLTEMFGPPE